MVFGWNKKQKERINIGAVNNQQFVQIPTARLKERIKQLCELHGIEFIEIEESYTSQASFLDNDFLPPPLINGGGGFFTLRAKLPGGGLGGGLLVPWYVVTA